MSQALPILAIDSLAFPSPHQALKNPSGLLALGGDLSVSRLYNAYKQGIFPWFNHNDPIMWWSPSPRAIIHTHQVKINRTLRKFLNKKPYTVTVNKAFNQVITYCADAPFRNDDTWILPEMIRAYQNMHIQGYAHSIEVWCHEELVGGLYGVAINGCFSGESMFYKSSNASKIALVALCQHLQSQQVNFIDCQLSNPFLKDMGCVEVDRSHFESLKDKAQSIKLPADFWQPKTLAINNTAGNL